MEWRSYGYETKHDKRIQIKISHAISSNDSYFNKLEVKGDDSTWVNGVLANLDEYLESVAPQNTTWKIYRPYLSALLSIGIGTIIMFSLLAIVNAVPIDVSVETPTNSSSQLGSLLVNLAELSPFLGFILKYGIFWFVGSFSSVMLGFSGLSNRLAELWPSVEIQVGPDHTLIERRRRFFLSQILLLGVLPLLLYLLSDLL
jgi:hypothetical protein